MRYLSIALLTSVMTQVWGQQPLNSIGQCIQEKKCGNDVNCQASCTTGNTEVYDNILKLQQCLNACDPSLPIESYQKCTLSCNGNPGTSSGTSPNASPSNQQQTPSPKDPLQGNEKKSDKDDQPTPSASSPKQVNTANSTSTNSLNDTKPSKNSTQSTTSESSSIVIMSASATGLFMFSIFATFI